MIYLHKILPLFFSPILVVLMLLCVGIATRRRAWVIGGACLLYAASTPLISDALFRSMEYQAEILPPEDAPKVDAIVALSAGMGWIKSKNGFLAQWPTPSRFLGGVELFAAGKAPLLVFTGGKLPWQFGEETEGDVLKRYAQMMQIPANNILVTDKAENTEQEARGAKQLLQPAHKDIILVTSAFHMVRAKKMFERAGFNVFAFPVDIRAVEQTVTLMSFLPDPRALYSTHISINELLGRLYYSVKES